MKREVPLAYEISDCIDTWDDNLTHQLGPGKAQGVSRICGVQDGKDASTKEGRQWSLGLSEDDGCAGGMWRDYYHHVYPVLPPDDCNACGNETNLQGLSAGQMAARVDAVSVVVGATDVLGRYQCNWIRCK
jgi:hypothetical protein